MTSVLSLTAVTSGGITNTTSALMYASDKKIDLFNLTALAPADIGALLTFTTSTNYSAITWSYIIFDSVEWDTGSWTDTNSTGLFRVPNDKWDMVEIGLMIDPVFAAFGTNYAFGITNTSTARPASSGLSAYPYAQGKSATANLNAGDGVVGYMPVSSGDTFHAAVYASNTIRFNPPTTTAFWIRGYSARA